MFERKISRRIYGPCVPTLTLRNGVWSIRDKEELKNLFQTPDVIAEITKIRLMWVGHA